MPASASIPLLRQLFEQVFVNFVAYRADRAGLVCAGAAHAAARFVQMAAVVKLAVAGLGLDIGHEFAQVHRRNVVQAKFLKAW